MTRRIIHGELCEGPISGPEIRTGDVLWILGCAKCGGDHRAMAAGQYLGRDGVFELLPRVRCCPYGWTSTVGGVVSSTVEMWRVINDQERADEEAVKLRAERERERARTWCRPSRRRSVRNGVL